VAIEDVQDLLVEEEVGEADLVEMASHDEVNQIESISDDDSGVNNFTIKNIQEVLSLAEKLGSLVLNVDPSAERSRKFKRELQNCLSPYHEIYNDLARARKQSKITDFLKIGKSAQNLNAEKSSESDDDIVQPNKRSRVIVLSSDEKEID
jgi:hypothetical protein